MPAQKKHSSTRRRRNVAASAAVLEQLEDGDEVEIPELPKRVLREIIDGVLVTIDADWCQETLDWWEDVWVSPMAGGYLDADMHGLIRLAVLVDNYWLQPSAKTHAEVRLAQKDFGLSTGCPSAHPAPSTPRSSSGSPPNPNTRQHHQLLAVTAGQLHGDLGGLVVVHRRRVRAVTRTVPMTLPRASHRTSFGRITAARTRSVVGWISMPHARQTGRVPRKRSKSPAAARSPAATSRTGCSPSSNNERCSTIGRFDQMTSVRARLVFD